MENYIVSARKYRPTTFESVVGQRALTTTLKNAIASGKLAHAYLFCGPRGVGKTTCARIFAKTINCLNPTAEGEACNECESCTAFNEQRSYNIHELDAASNNSVDDIRALVDQVRIPPQIGKYKVYIIDEVHMLSQAAFNAFLKTLEEPPHHAIFILATTEKHKILPTILSRCQIYDFNRIGVEDTVAHLAYVASKEGITAEPEALNVIALKADGGMRDALSIFDQVVSFTGGHITYQSVIENLNVLDYEYYFRLTDYFLENKVSDALLLLNDVLNKGFDANHFITGLSSHFRDLLVSRDAATLPLLEVGASIRQRYQTQAQKCPLPFLYRAMKLCNDCDLNYRASKNKRLLVELTLIQAAQLTAEQDDPVGGRSPKQEIKPIAPLNPPKGGTQEVSSQKSEVSSQKPEAKNEKTVIKSSPFGIALPRQTGEPGGGVEGGAPTTEKKIPTMKMSSLGISIKKSLSPQPSSPVGRVSEDTPSIYSPLPTGLLSPDKRGSQEGVGSGERLEEASPVTEADLNHYWQEYASRMPQDRSATARRMQNMTVALISETTFEALVENEIVAQEFTSIIPDIQTYLRAQLHNNKVTMTVRVSEDTETTKVFGRTEKYQMMSQKNEAVQLLKDEFGLEFD